MAPDACTATPRASHVLQHGQDSCKAPPLLPDVRLHDWNSCKVRSSDRTDQTDRAIPRAFRLELRLEPRPDDRTDRTGARLPRPTRHSKTHGRARLSLGREETEDGHAFSSGGPSGQESDRTQKVNSIDNNKIDELTAKDKATAENTLEADQSANDQNEVSYVNGQGWQFKNYHPNPNVRNNPHLYNYLKLETPADNPQNNQGQKAGYQKGYNQNHQGKTYVLSQAQYNQFQNQKQLTNQQVAPAATTAPQDELKSLDMMMQQLLQGQ
ncbi:hypothetical protein F2Q69_00020000 [Brassica cretica]|uniref:Uncharacterized protein n=1 Tax=Brassica cretica TaxID=69181 RepID=A0A8S9PXU1_BRACR|nr:hypothetical protein F2Q69_00020000 [Brassica cretica]